MTSKNTTGFLLAAAAAALFSTANIAYAADESSAGDQVKCSGVNACKGLSECATAASSCKGHNSCKGQGFLQMTKSDCDAKGGTVMEDNK